MRPNQWRRTVPLLAHAICLTLTLGLLARAAQEPKNDFHFSMGTSKASPKLMLACATGQHLRDGTLTVRRAGFEFGQRAWRDGDEVADATHLEQHGRVAGPLEHRATQRPDHEAPPAATSRARNGAIAR